MLVPFLLAFLLGSAVGQPSGCQLAYNGPCSGALPCCNTAHSCLRHVSSPACSNATSGGSGELFRCAIAGGFGPVTPDQTSVQSTTSTTSTTGATSASTQQTTTSTTTLSTSASTQSSTSVAPTTTSTLPPTTSTTSTTTTTTIPPTTTTTTTLAPTTTATSMTLPPTTTTTTTVPPTTTTTTTLPPTTTTSTTTTTTTTLPSTTTTTTTTLAPTTTPSGTFGPLCGLSNKCFTPGQCFNGQCVGQTNKTCPPLVNQPCKVNQCSPATGSCQEVDLCTPLSQCHTASCLNGVCSQTVRTNASCTVTNPCYTGAGTCDATGSCFPNDNTARAVGFVCIRSACVDIKCTTVPFLDLLQCADVVTKITCTPSADPCMQNTCSPLTGTCQLTSPCVSDSPCQTSSCSVVAGLPVCSTLPVGGQTSNPSITTTPSAK
jgi:hypothetical protein